MNRFLVGILSLVLISVVHAGDGPLKSDPIATLFGSHPDIRGVRLSPDGSKLSFLKTHPDGYTIATVLDLTGPKLTGILNSDKDENDIQWCRWVNEERLLCAYVMQVKARGSYMPVTRVMATRLVGVNADGTEVSNLLEDRLGDDDKYEFSQIQTNIIDILPEDRDHVLIQTVKLRGTGVAIMDVYSGRFTTKERIRDRVGSWISDGHGNPRLYFRSGMSKGEWHLISPGELSNEVIREVDLEDTIRLDDMFSPEGFGENPDEVLYFGLHEDRTALFAMNLSGDDRSSRLVYAHPRVDIASTHRLGKYDRLVGAIYYEETRHTNYFDTEIGRIEDRLRASFPNNIIGIVDEDWSQRYYLVIIASDTNPGTYYRFDRQENKLARIGPVYSTLKDTPLSRMKIISYPSRDGTAIPAYLSLPSGEHNGLPAVVLPHGGPSSRDVWGFDFLVQFLTAKGFAVLQSNYRGSYGYGKEWLGDGAFRNWRTAIDDITDGAKYIVDEGIADPGRICTVGWSYGGYAALMSGIEEPERYRCIVSIAGVTDPRKLGWAGGRSARIFIGTDEEVTEQGSPVNRAGEIQAPVLLVHGENDLNVPIEQSELIHDALEEQGKSVQFITYENAQHSITPERYRIDLLTRVGEFLELHTR